MSWRRQPLEQAIPVELGAYDVILIDGRSGSGKTSLAERLAQRQRSEGGAAQVLHVEDLYPGWDGLEAGSRAVAVALAEGAYRPYDWGAGEFSASIALIDTRPLIIEGCGAITAENLAAARTWAGDRGHILSIWIEGSEELRQERAFARDGDTYRPYWDRWAAQEARFFAAARPETLADKIIPITIALD